MQSHEWGSHTGPAKALKPPKRERSWRNGDERDHPGLRIRALSVPNTLGAFPVRLHSVSCAWMSERVSLDAVESISWGWGGSWNTCFIHPKNLSFRHRANKTVSY